MKVQWFILRMFFPALIILVIAHAHYSPVFATGHENNQVTESKATLFPTLERDAVGCILPLSGAFAGHGNKALDAILLAAGFFDGDKKTPWKIFVEDSRGLPEAARMALINLAEKKNVMAVIALAGTAEAFEIVREVDRLKIPVILITPKEGISEASNYIFQHFLTPSQQIRALVNYALDNLNCVVYSIIYPQDDYGAEMAKIFRAEAGRIGGKIEQAVFYSKSQTDFTEEINKITGYRAPKKATPGKPKPKPQRIFNFDALFIPDSHLRVKMITSQLAFYDIRGIRLLGTSLWNAPGLLKSGGEYLEGAVFTDSFFANSFHPETNDFVDAYYTAYGREPENIEALSYDTMEMILSVLQNENIQTREQFIGALHLVKDFRGATGITSFGPDRVSRKTPFILQVKDGKLLQVK